MIDNIFPTKILKVKFTGDVDKLYSVIEPILNTAFEKTVCNNQGSMRYDGLCSYNAQRTLHQLPELQELTDFIQKHAQIYWDELSYLGTPYIAEMWANKYVPGSFIELHNHSPIPVTASFYLKKPKDSGNIVFESPMATLLKHQPYDFIRQRELYHTLFEHEVEVEQGDLVFFPAYLQHRTQPNNSNEDRIIIGSNIKYAENM